MKEETRKQHLCKVSLVQVWDLNTEEVNEVTDVSWASSSSSNLAEPSLASRRGFRCRLFEDEDNTDSDIRSLDMVKDLSVTVDTFADLVVVPRSVLDGIWGKAYELVTESNAVSLAPGYDNGRTVKSSSGKRPHLVLSKANGQYCCDRDCGNHRSLGICSHSVAVAEINGELHKFVEWFIKAKKATKHYQSGVNWECQVVEDAKVVFHPRKERNLF